MNKLDINKLKFQLIMILKQNMGEILVIAIMSINLGLGNAGMIYYFKNEMMYDTIPFAVISAIALLSIACIYLIKVYQQTASYFMSIGYTRKRYYFGTFIFSIILSIMSTFITLTTYMVIMTKDKTHLNNDIVPYMGFYFKSLSLASIKGIIIITFLVSILIFAVANFVSIIALGSKYFKIIIKIIIILLLIFVIIPKDLNFKLVSLIFDVNKSFSLTMLSYVLISTVLYILAKKIFMRIDIK